MSTVTVRRLASALVVSAALAWPVMAQPRPVLFVDNTRSGGDGSFDHPFATIRQGVAAARGGAVIYVAETTTPYDESISLATGQMLIGSAFGLEAVRAEYHVELNAPVIAAMKGTGPVIHGSVMLSGNNVVAGCTIDADRTTGPALSANAPQGTLGIRDVHVRTADQQFGLALTSDDYATNWTGGALQAEAGGSGILIEGGMADIVFDRVAVSGVFTTALTIAHRSGGSVVFRDRSRIAIDDALLEGVRIESTKGVVQFESPLQLRTAHGRGIVVRSGGKFIVSGEASWIEASNVVALDIRETEVDAAFDHVSAQNASEGVVIDKIRGRLEVAGGSIDNARNYAVRITQSSGVLLRNMKISGGGTSTQQECPPDIPRLTNLRCRAALFLRHVENSSFANIDIAAPSGVGLNLNNVSRVTFSGIHISSAGQSATEPSVLIDEIRGELSFAACSFVDGAGGAIVIEQQFNSGRVAFDRCEISAPKRAAAAPFLVHAEVKAPGSIALKFTVCSLHESDGGAVALDVGQRATAALSITGTPVANIGGKAIDVSAAAGSRASLVMSGNAFVLPENREAGLVHFALAPNASGCIDASANKLLGGTGPQLRIDAPADAQLLIVGASTSEELSSRNGGAGIALGAAALRPATSCP